MGNLVEKIPVFTIPSWNSFQARDEKCRELSCTLLNEAELIFFGDGSQTHFTTFHSPVCDGFALRLRPNHCSLGRFEVRCQVNDDYPMKNHGDRFFHSIFFIWIYLTTCEVTLSARTIYFRHCDRVINITQIEDIQVKRESWEKHYRTIRIVPL